MAGRAVSRAEFDRLDRDVNGNGQPGIRQDVEKILMHQAEVKGILAERTKVENRHFKKVTIALSILVVILMALGILLTVHMNYHGEIQVPKLFPHQTIGESVLAQGKNAPQDAVSKYPAKE